jgi:serine/threonine protein kinase
VFTDYLEGGDLQVLLDKKQKLPEGDVKFYTSEIVLGIDHLHKVGALQPLPMNCLTNTVFVCLFARSDSPFLCRVENDSQQFRKS